GTARSPLLYQSTISIRRPNEQQTHDQRCDHSTQQSPQSRNRSQTRSIVLPKEDTTGLVSFRMIEYPVDSVNVQVCIKAQCSSQCIGVVDELIVCDLLPVAPITGTWVYNFPTFRVRIARLNSPPAVG